MSNGSTGSLIDVLFNIQAFIDPNPVHYLSFALVSRDWKFVFTSDRAWKWLNPYGAHKDIIKTFWQELEMSTDLERRSLRARWLLKAAGWHSPVNKAHLFDLLAYLCYDSILDDELVIDNRQLLWCAVHFTARISWASPRLQADRECILIAAERFPGLLEALPQYADDYEVVLTAVCNDGFAVAYASERLCANRTIAKAAINRHPQAVTYLSSDLHDDEEIMLHCMRQFPEAIRYVSRRLTDNYDIALAAVSRKSHYLELVSERLRDNEQIVLAAIATGGSPLRYASRRLRADPTIVEAALCTNMFNLPFVIKPEQSENKKQRVN